MPPSITTSRVPVIQFVPCKRLLSTNLVLLALFLSNTIFSTEATFDYILYSLPHYGCLFWSTYRRQGAAASEG